MNKSFLNQALEQAALGQGFCAPNPAVGALIIQEGTVTSKGYHKGCGEAHAEVEAINQAGGEINGATMVVTLEPCCHWGKTPPCTEQIIAAGISKVIYACGDPNPAVAGKGIAQLRAAGIVCEQVSCEAIDNFYRPYVYWQQTGLPWFTFKMATTLDGKIAHRSGQPIKLTGDKLAVVTHQQRRNSDAILTTAKTIIQDDPQLNCRFDDETIAKPIYVIDAEALCPVSARIFETAASVTIFHAATAAASRLAALRERGASLMEVGTDKAGLDCRAIKQILGDAGKHRVWIEAGGRLLQTLLNAKLCQQCLLYCSTQSLGSEGYDGFHQAIDFRQAAKVQWHSLGEECYCDITWESNICLPA